MTITTLGLPRVPRRLVGRASQAPSTGTLVDSYGRHATDMRVSLTDKCNLRCTYCMPAEGLPWLPSDELLTDDEMVRLVSVAASLGVTTVRLTGGEPLIRPRLPGLVARLAEHRELSLPTHR